MSGNEDAARLWRYFYSEAIPADERAWFETVGWIPLDDILLVDDLGDAFHPPPHLLVKRNHEHGFFTDVRSFLTLNDGTGERLDPADLRRAKLFAEEIPEPEDCDRW